MFSKRAAWIGKINDAILPRNLHETRLNLGTQRRVLVNLRSLFKNAGNLQEYPAGTTIFAEGARAYVMYVVLDGEVEVRIGGKPVEVIGPGDIVGEMALIDGKPRSATAVAKSDCRLAPVDEKRFHSMVQQTPEFSLHVMRVVVDRLRRMNTKIET